MKELRYLGAWLLMPLLAIKHKIKRVSHYEIKCGSGVIDKQPDCISAYTAFEVLLNADLYGDSIKLVEVCKGGSRKVIMSVEW